MNGNMATETRTNLIVNHLPHNLTEPEFEKLFGDIGLIKSYRIMRDLKNGSSFGFGFVEFQNPADAAKAILKLNNYGIQHKRLKVSYAQPADGGDIKDTNLYIQNVPRTYTVDKLEQMFSPYGRITQKLIFRDKATGLPKGIAFVKYQNRSEAYSAIEHMNGQILEGGTEPLIVKIAKDGTSKKNSSFQAGYQAGLARGGGGSRGRAQYNNRGYGRGSYTEMKEGRGFGNPSEFSVSDDFNQQAGKIGLDRSNNRYNPIGTGGGYGTTSNIGVAYGASIGIREPTPMQFTRVNRSGFTGGFSYPVANFVSVPRPAEHYAGARY